ncbi:hypothetical protein BXY82_0959 [Gelidibacter sediminis]|uniref:O-antigen ligase-like membrane protein n=1 Tax=Gelidibacter sediminis TaxID=1608710 RepID=A0A4R7Q7E7_9FLAO|nr:hypothetical protein [Gelidibacter sediminis]TDU43545.1 hypothetical protein BXY82_0959 [Gelidibacter sediminis]
MIKIKKLYALSFIFIILACFVFGGFIQFFIGIPNTVFSYSITALLLAFYALYVLVKQKVFFDRVVLLFSLFFLVIVISTIANQTPILKTLIYFIFVLLPLGCYLFFKVNQKEGYISQVTISRVYVWIACLQLPVILIQYFGYDFLIEFNRSNQSVANFDFMFGTFFLKADHAMGFFLLFTIFNLIENNKQNQITQYSNALYGYLGLTIFISESNISKLILGVFILYIIYKAFPRKVKLFGILAIVLLAPLVYAQITKIPAVDKEIQFMKAEYNVEKSYRNYENGIAKRAQVIITYANKIPLKIIGDGPYSYYNILKGEFTKTKHFSQVIWTYADLGLFGVIIFVMLLYALVKSLALNGYISVFVFSIILIFSFMTTVFSDLGIMITLTSLLQKRNSHA